MNPLILLAALAVVAALILRGRPHAEPVRVRRDR